MLHRELCFAFCKKCFMKLKISVKKKSMEFSHKTCKPNVFIIVVTIIILFSHTNKHSMWAVLMQFLSSRLVCVCVLSYSPSSKHALGNEYLILLYFNCTLLVLFKLILIFLLCFYSVDRHMCGLNNCRDTFKCNVCLQSTKEEENKGMML